MTIEKTSHASAKKGTMAGAIGNVLEWYDFSVYAYFAPVFGNLFFPSHDPVVSLINTFGVFAIGYLMRPIGGIILGQIGDKFGRKKALVISVLMMAIPSALVGCLPTYQKIGILAPILLTFLRVIQGLSVGGEMIGSMSYLVEIAPKNRKGLFGSWSLFSAVLGILVGSAVGLLMNQILPQSALSAWGWRLPFIFGIIIGVVGVWMRSELDESPAYMKAYHNGEIKQHPFIEALRTAPYKILQVALMNVIMGTAFYTLFVWMPTYLTKLLPFPVPHALLLNTIAMLLLIWIMPLAGLLSDIVGRKPVMLVCVVGIMITVYPLFKLIGLENTPAIMTAFVVFALWVGGLYGTMPAAMAEMFPSNIRYSATGLGYNIAFALFCGTAPMVSTWLIHKTGDLTSPAVYLTILAVISLPAYILFKPAKEI